MVMASCMLVVLAATVKFCASNPDNTPESDLERFKADWKQSLSALDMHALIDNLFDLVQNSGSQAFEVSSSDTLDSCNLSPTRAHTHNKYTMPLCNARVIFF